MKTKILILSMLLLTGVATGFAQSGDSLTWTLENGTLTISGTGAMRNYSTSDMPWGFRSSITAVEIGDGVTSIGSFAFANYSSLTSIAIPGSVTRIGYGAFLGCTGLTSITIPDGVTSIETAAFYGCRRLTSITIPNSVTSIGWHAFAFCRGLTSITIPNGMTSIGRRTFSGCRRLTSVTNLNPTPQNASGVFSKVKLKKATLYVPVEAIAAYHAADVWKDFGTIKAYEP